MIRLFLVILVLVIGFHVAPEASVNEWKSKIQEAIPAKLLPTFGEIKKTYSLETKKDEIQVNRGLSVYGIPIGVTASEVEATLGKPSRIDPSGYGFDWWIYNEDLLHYIQVGMKDGRVTTVFSNGEELSVGGMVRGDSYEILTQTYPVNDTFEVKYDGATFTINQNETDMTEHPIVAKGDVAIQFFIDIHDNHRITSIQLMDIPTMLKIGNVAISYRYIGSPPDITVPDLESSQQKAVNLANEKQVLDLTNTVRLREGLQPLKWNEEAAVVARSHSVDMKENHFFAHESPETGSPFERLENAGISYVSAGENIAMGYRTSISVHEGWMNSMGHRENILKPQFETLGVGALSDYFTQDFVTYP